LVVFDKETGNLVMCKSSWHYRLVTFIWGTFFWGDRINLCPYMRRVVLGIFLFPFVAGWDKLVPKRLHEYTGLCQALAIYVMIILTVSVFLDYIYVDTPWHIFAVAGVFGGFAIAAIAALVILVVMRLKDKWDDRPYHYNEHKTMGIAKAYVSAKHEKVCPSIKFCDAPEMDKNGTRVRQDKDCP